MNSTETSVLGSTDALVKEALGKFIYQHTRQDALSAIDEIVLSYVVSILETLATESGDDGFDVDQFSEMMSAYLPAFSKINSAAVCEWMFQLASWLAKQQVDGKTVNSFQKTNTKPEFLLTLESTLRTENKDLNEEISYISSDNTSICSCSSNASQSEDEMKQTHHLSDETITNLNDQIKLLTEMFPHMCTSEIQHCITATGGDCQKAAQYLLQRQDNREMVHKPKLGQQKSKTGKYMDNFLQDKELREQILNRYAYIDKDDDAREHKPVAPKSVSMFLFFKLFYIKFPNYLLIIQEPKKLIRYRDNKIVSVKGERYSEVKTEESEDMKKTYVTLKPARQYRFH